MDSLNPESPPQLEVPMQRAPRVWKFWGTLLWGLVVFGAMFAGQIAVVFYFVFKPGGPADFEQAPEIHHADAIGQRERALRKLCSRTPAGRRP